MRESLAILLIALLPLHAFLVTVGTKVLVGPGHAPLMILSMWKEGVVLVLYGLVVLEWIFKTNLKSEIRKKFKIQNIAIDCLDLCIAGLFVIALFLTDYLSLTTDHFIFGFKYTLFPLSIFFIFRRVAWSQGFAERASKILVGVGIAVALYGIISFFLSMKFFTWLGYSDLHSLYLPGNSLAAFQQIGETGLRRIQSTFSGPNQMGIWLLIPLGFVLSQWWTNRRVVSGQWSVVSFFTILFVALVMTFSRAAWVGAGVMVLWTLFRIVPSPSITLRAGSPAPLHVWIRRAHHDMQRSGAYRETIRKAMMIFSGFGIMVLFIIFFLFFPNILLRKESTLDHVRRPMEAVRVMVEHPWGLGLGSAGPASNRVSDPCVYLTNGADASWAKDRPELCIFVGESQVQPEEPCQCPLLPENWYLQMGVELGIAGFVLFVILVVLILKQWSVGSLQWSVLSFMGISVAAVFLHAWEDSAVAYTVWMLLAAALPVAPWRRGS